VPLTRANTELPILSHGSFRLFIHRSGEAFRPARCGGPGQMSSLGAIPAPRNCTRKPPLTRYGSGWAPPGRPRLPHAPGRIMVRPLDWAGEAASHPNVVFTTPSSGLVGWAASRGDGPPRGSVRGSWRRRAARSGSIVSRPACLADGGGLR